MALLPTRTRSRVALALLAAVVGYSAVLGLVLGQVVFPSFARFEREDAIRNLDRVAQAIRRELAFLADFSRDWAHWDDTYAFVTDADPDYVEANLTEAATANVPADILVLYDHNGQLRYTGIYRAATARADEARRLLTADGALFRSIVQPLLQASDPADRQETVILRLGGQPLLAVGHVILRSDRSGPPRGVLLMAGVLDADDQRSIEAQTLVDFDLHDAGQAPLLPVPPAELFRTGEGDEGRIEVLGDDRMRLSVRFRTADGGTFIATSDYARHITEQARFSLGLAWAISIGSFVLLVLVFYRRVLVRAFLAPLHDVVGVLRRIEQGHDLGVRLPEQGVDELKCVAQAFNRMMGEVEAHRDEVAALSLTDPLTGLANRRQFDQVFEREFLRAQRQRSSLALLVVDVDSFKAYNDHFGHPQGDVCLRQVADALHTGLRRGTDLLARLGGEEFVAVIPDSEEAAARHTAESLLQFVRALGIAHPHAASGSGHVSISVGLKAGVPSADASTEKWMAAADAALYLAKRQGRDRCAVAPG